MAIFEVQADGIRPIPVTTFDQAGLRERYDLQRLLRKQIDVIVPDTLIIAEEFGEWEESKRRIDLLGLGKDANLVVIELKRSEDGGHMELQAIRYAAMVSTMTFEKVVEIYGRFLGRTGSTQDPRAAILEFLEWEEPDEDRFAQDVRIVLVSAEFSKELMTSVMWLNDRDLDIRCIRIKPYGDDGRVLIDVQQVIPLPEATEYQIQIREKEQRVRQDRSSERYRLRREFWTGLLAQAVKKTNLHAHISPGESQFISARLGISGLSYNHVISQHEGRVELYIDRGDFDVNKRVFDSLIGQKDQIETDFGGPLSWERLDEKRACRVSCTTTVGGYRDDPPTWPAVYDKMIRLEKALGPRVKLLTV